jgi:hypothetical protein
MSDEIMPQVEDASRYRERRVRVTNAYRTHYDSLGYYDLGAYDAWEPDRKEDPPSNLPWEITRDDRRQEVEWSEAEFRHLITEGQKIIAAWDSES